MAKCDFCTKNIEPGTGKKFIQKDGKIVDLCSSKCQKHMFKLKHKGRLTRWTKVFQKEKQKK